MADVKISELPTASTVSDSDIVVINQGGTTKTATRGLVNTPTGVLPVANGGTGVAVSSGASSVVLRDASQNVTVNSVIEGYSAITASGTQVVLTVASAPSYLVTGSGGQTIKLPDATTLQNGVVYLFNNNQSSGAISVNNNSDTLVASIPSGGFTAVSLLSNSIAAGSWERHEQAPSNVSWSTNTLDYPGSITSATWNGNAVAINRGGTGQSTFTDGQLLIGNTTGNTLTKATLTAGTNMTVTNGNGAITLTANTGATPTNIQTFTTSGTWTKPANAKQVLIECVSGGGGGGYGGKGAAGTALYGGGGGGGGGYSRTLIDASELTEASYTVTVGTGGAGGIGSNLTNATLGTFTRFIGAVQGQLAGANPGGTVAGNGGTVQPTTGSAGAPAGNTGGTASITGTGGTGSGQNFAPSSGGAGGGLTAAATVGSATGIFSGGSGGNNSLVSLISSGGAASSAGNGTSATSTAARTLSSLVINGSGGGGGGACSFATGSGGNGANGSGYGSGGGGGGSTIGSGNGGNGGNGADGLAVITTYF